MNYPIITIAREYGSGGRIIAQKLAEKFGIPFYDRKLIEMAAKQTGLSEDFVAQAEQYRTSSLLYNLYMSSQSLPLSDQVYIAQCQVIRDVAKQSACVIVGRCADYVLSDLPNCLHVFVHAPLEERIRRVRDEYGVQQSDLKGYVQKYDKRRASYYNYFTTHEWGRSSNYDLTINSATTGIDGAVQVISALVEARAHKA